MENWTLWLAAIVASMGAAALTSFLLCQVQIASIRKRILLLEREVSLARFREENQEKTLSEVFDALSSLQKTTDQLFRGLRERISQALAIGRTESLANR